MESQKLRVIDASAWMTDIAARLPFRFGIVTMRGAPLCVLRVIAETTDGQRHEGYASDLLVPKWFEKDPRRSLAQSWDCLTSGITETCAAVVCNPRIYASAFDHWQWLYNHRVASWTGDRSWRLLLGHGVSLVERALIDAACRSTSLPFHHALAGNVLGVDMAGSRLGLAVRRRVDVVHVRHTVGLVDPLDDGDDAPRPDDDLPVTLAEAIRAYGLTHFKLKISGDVGADLDRLERIAAVLQRECADPPVCTLDGNEQFASIDRLHDLVRRLRDRPRTAWLRDRIIAIEQPLSRRDTLNPNANGGLEALCREIPVYIDEADLDREAFLEAVEIGYRGVSVKNCKGVFRAMFNALWCHFAPESLFLSGEDLTNVPVLALQQDLVTASCFGVRHVERNGHHYFAGLAHLPAAERAAAVERHPELYGGDPPRLLIRDGTIDVAALHRTRGYGYDGPVDVESRIPLSDWTPFALLERIAAT